MGVVPECLWLLGDYVPSSYDSRVERVCACIDACVDLYVLVGIAVSCTGAGVSVSR